MSLRRAEEQDSGKIHIPTDINWDMLDKSKFFILGAGLFSGVSFILYPVVVLKTRQQISSSNTQLSSFKTAGSIIRYEGFFKGFYRGFGTSLMGTIPARALYMTALEVTKSNVGPFVMKMGFSEGTAMASANAIAGLTAAMAAQLVWTPIDVVSQRLMVQGSGGSSGINKNPTFQYSGGIDAFRKIVKSDGIRGLYRGFGMSTVTYAPSNAIWWASYSISQRVMWGGYSCYLAKKGNGTTGGASSCSGGGGCISPSAKTVMAVQGLSAAMAGGFSALVTMPLDTIKTRLQVLDGCGNGSGSSAQPTIRQTVKNLVKEGGWSACYRGLGPRWVSSSFSATTMITTYELLKRLSAKNYETM
ncbi:hypothetical protein C5167_017855 [Papaver somniferum]|uniref:Mitochondrial carrier protein n=1 Tax=Papaver somniferum TaxID=3469 RepID=A0A4Y7IMT6_PAPSO|nr:solute carrier family 25 member 44-like [Papaver somniferum]RZC49436.1 hypothetical protein C5167_017855 [Papaver somniferum]